MGWNYQTSVERAQKRWDATADLNVADVVRVTDFNAIALNAPRRVVGCHLYVDVTNFNSLLREAEDDADRADMVRLLHIWQREVSKILDAFEVVKVHFQGPRLHAISYRPISNSAEQVSRALLAALAARHAATAFATEFGVTWTVAAGLDHGKTVATRNGAAGDRELLFLGHAANHAAKILQSTGIRLTQDARDLLPPEFDDYITDGDPITATMSTATVTDMADNVNCEWTIEETRERLAAAATSYPNGCVSVSGVKESIDKGNLALSNTKAVIGASVFADVDGFTAYVDKLMTDDEDLIDAIRRFHVLRGEGRDTAVQDFSALRVQYQGDRMQALVYKPIDDEVAIAIKAVELAAALNTVAGVIVPKVCDGDVDTPFAIGISTGRVLVTKIGEQGNRDLVVIGQSIAQAASIQQRLEGGQIGLAADTWKVLPEWLQEPFKWSTTARAYVATDLTHSDYLDLKASNDSRAMSSVTSKAFAAPAEEPLRPWRAT